ncbi:MAG: 2-dehydropantoate 2-reductase [Desulfobacterales bacterium]
MDIVILGAGATGSILAAHLIKAGENVTLIARGARAEYLRTNGITITGLADFTVPCSVVTDPGGVKRTDLLIVTVKTYDTESALRGLAHLDLSAAVSVQNGVMKNDQLAAVFGKENTLGGAFFCSGEVAADGAVRFTLNQCFYVGELGGGVTDRVRHVVDILAHSGITSEASPMIGAVEWSKFISWLGMMSLSVLTRMETWKFLENRHTALIGVRIMKEAAGLAERLGIPLEDNPPFPIRSMRLQPEEETVETLHGIGEFMKAATPDHRVSALQDLERGRRLEAGETLGYVLERARAEKIEVPTVTTVFHLISGIDDHNRLMFAESRASDN